MTCEVPARLGEPSGPVSVTGTKRPGLSLRHDAPWSGSRSTRSAAGGPSFPGSEPEHLLRRHRRPGNIPVGVPGSAPSLQGAWWPRPSLNADPGPPEPPTVSGSWSLQNRVDLPPGSSGDPPSPSLPCAPARHLAARRQRDRPRRVGGSSRMAPGSTLRPPASTRLSPARRPGRSFGAAAGPVTPAVHPPPPRAGGCWISGRSSESLY